jgi:hypothetical protein
MARKKIDKRLIFLIILVIGVLAIANIVVFTRSPPSAYCYKDVCILGKNDSVQEIRALMNSSTKAILVIEGDSDPSQKSAFVSGALVLLAKDFGNKQEQLIGIKYSDGQPVECICSDFDGMNFTSCPGNSTAYCTTVAPGPSEMLLKVPYPSFSKDEIIVSGRTIVFQAKSGPDAFAMVGFFEDLFIKKVIG